MSLLIIGEAQRRQIADLRALAAANPMDPREAQKAADKNMAAYRNMMSTMSVSIPDGYVVTYSHEVQPGAGLCHHISISMSHHGRLPPFVAVDAILSEFGMLPLNESAAVWLENAAADTRAVNVVQPIIAAT